MITLNKQQTDKASGGVIPWGAIAAGIAAYTATKEFLEGYSEGLQAGLDAGMKGK